MLSNFNWLQYGTFVLVSLLVYYAVIFLLYYRQEMLELAARVSGKGKRADDAAEQWSQDDPGIIGEAKPEPGLSKLSMEELNIAGAELLQGELADCLEEISFSIKLAREHDWDKRQLMESFAYIPGMYPAVFRHSLAGSVIEHIVAEGKQQLDMELGVKELRQLLGIDQQGKAKLIAAGTAVLAFVMQVSVSAQDGNSGITEATNKVKGYFDTGTDLMYAIGAIMGLIGAVKVYSKWNAGEPDTAKVATAWFGSCIFLVVVATVLKSFFGI